MLLSSHLLHEIEVIADDLVVIGNGRIVAQGTKAELLASRRHLRPARRRRRPGPRAGRRRASPRRRSGDDALRADADPELVGKVALAAGVPLVELRAADGAGLEEMFLELTADTSTEKEQQHDHR